MDWERWGSVKGGGRVASASDLIHRSTKGMMEVSHGSTTSAQCCLSGNARFSSRPRCKVSSAQDLLGSNVSWIRGIVEPNIFHGLPHENFYQRN